MDKIRIIGGVPLKGTIEISGAKNSALPLICAGLLTKEKLILHNSPTSLSDVVSMGHLLEHLGAKITVQNKTLTIEAKEILSTKAPYDLVKKMRASILVLGPLLARFGRASVSYPGGCAIGARPMDVTLDGLEALGAKIILEEGYIHATAPEDGLKGTEYRLRLPAVTGTENLIMAAVFAKGNTTLYNTACEPEIVDLCECMNQMGAKISGIGTPTIKIEGVTSLSGAEHQVLPDRIETGTYAIAAVITGGHIVLTNTRTDILRSVLTTLENIGAIITETDNGFSIKAPSKLTSINISTEPYPGYPTDLQAQMMALMSIASGNSTITENIFENRFMHVPELCRMGAEISTDGKNAYIKGVTHLKGAPVMATDLRASVSLVLAGLKAHGETIVDRIYHLDRGYENIEEKLRACGANIQRIKHN